MRRIAKIHWSIPLAVVLLIAASGGLWWRSQIANSRGDVSQNTLNTAIEAVAASENGKYDRALTLWDDLLKSNPGDADLLLNQAVTVLKWIDESRSKLNSGKISDPAEQAKLQEELTAAFTKAEITIAEVAKLPGSDGRTALLQAKFFEAKSLQLQPPDDKPLLQQAAKTLVDVLAKNPAQPLLACQLDDLFQANGGEDDALAKQCGDALYASWKLEPRNLYVLSRASDYLLKSNDPRLKELLLPSLELAKPMLSLLKSSMGRMKPDELLPKISAAIDAGDWRQVQVVRQWFNILTGTSGFRADVRLVKPDIMALLDTSFLNRFAESNRRPPTSQTSPLRVEYSSRILSDADVACWFDVDVDLDFDVAFAHGNQLRLYITSPESGVAGTLQQELELPFAPSGMIPIDLHEVDSPSRPRTSVAKRIQGTQDTPTAPAAVPKEQIADANRHDTYQELVMWGEAGIAILASTESPDRNSRVLTVLETPAGLSGLDKVKQVEPSDIDGDGDLDLIVACQSKIVILQNNGNRTFADVSEFSSLPNPDFYAKCLFACDIDRDLDQDVLLVSGESGVFMLENILHSQFRFRKLANSAWDEIGASVDVVAADLDGNSSWDVFAIGEGGTTGVLTSTPAMGQWLSGRSIKSPATGKVLRLADLNNDAALDMLTASESGLQVRWGKGGADWDSSEQSVAPGKATSLSIIDADRDGNLELLSIIEGKAVLLSASQPASGQYVEIRLRGIADNNGGGRINHYTIGSTLELWSNGRMQVREVREPVTHFGIGQQQPKNLRIMFNNGLTQNVTEVEPSTLIEEVQELKGSCPFVYGWDGEQFQLITDLLWNAPLGLQVARGQVLPDRRWEYLLLPGELMQPKDGHYELRITEELWEVAYFDHIALTAVDHPANVEVFTNEKVGPPSIAEPRIFTAQQKIFAHSATDSQGRDCRAKLTKVDRDFVQAFDQLICQGLAEPHFIELDFGTLDPSQPWRLFLNGWMHPADTSLNIGMSQNPERLGPEPPSLWVLDQAGKWVCAQPFMGFPGGKPKSIVIDLAGVFQSDDHRIRIGSSQQLYWDQAFVANDSSAENIQQSHLVLQSAELHYRGFGKLLPRAADQPHNYDYQIVNRSAKWSELQGPFTRFGNVRELLLDDDDRMVVMVSGDEFIAKFAMPEQPLPEGWRRDFILHNVGWDKDADLNTLSGDGSLPLPFKAMHCYPPPFEQADAAAEVLRKNATQLTRKHQVGQASSLPTSTQ